MKKRIKKLLSNKYLRVAVVSIFIMILISFFYFILLLSVGSRMSANLISILTEVFEIVITIPAIIIIISVSIMGIRTMIYGNEVKHDKTYWEDALSEQEDSNYGNKK